jgi:hypothetical protein
VDPTWFLAGVEVTLIILALNLWLRLRDTRRHQLCWLAYSRSLVTDRVTQIRGLSVLFNGIPVNTFTQTTVVFWNCGTEVVGSADIETVNPLRITIEGSSRILSAEITKTNHEASQFVAHMSDDYNGVLLRFDYLNAGKGARISLFHTAASDAKARVQGDVRGIDNLTEVDEEGVPLKVYLGIMFGSSGIFAFSFFIGVFLMPQLVISWIVFGFIVLMLGWYGVHFVKIKPTIPRDLRRYPWGEWLP